jgi:hypothetical protein
VNGEVFPPCLRTPRDKHVIPHNEEVKDYKSTSAKIAEQSKVSPKTQYEEDESGVVTVTTPKKTELK